MHSAYGRAFATALRGVLSLMRGEPLALDDAGAPLTVSTDIAEPHKAGDALMYRCVGCAQRWRRR